MTKFHGFLALIFIAVALTIAAPIILIGRCNKEVKQLESDIEKKESWIGERIIINKDTLTITDYSIWNDNYSLSNGAQVDYELVKKQLTPNTFK